MEVTKHASMDRSTASPSSGNANEVHPLLLEVIDILAEFGKQWSELCARQGYGLEAPTQIAEFSTSVLTSTAITDKPRQARNDRQLR